MKVATIGLDIAKHIFQVHGADAEGRPLLRRRLRRNQVGRYFVEPAAVCDRDGSLLWRALLESCDRAVWPYRPPDGATVRQAIR